MWGSGGCRRGSYDSGAREECMKGEVTVGGEEQQSIYVTLVIL